MNRRDILKYTALVTGAAVSGPLASSLLFSCQREGTSTTSLSFFSESEMKRLQKLVDTILPATDSPAASEVGVHTMIDHMVGTVYPPEDRKAYRMQFERLDQYLRENDFDKDLGTDQELALLLALDPPKSGALAAAATAFLTIKQQTVAYYLNTESIATKFLNYLPVPGAYQACISLEEVDYKAWAE